MLIVINCILYAVLGIVWASANMNGTTWQYWVSLLCVALVQIANRLMA